MAKLKNPNTLSTGQKIDPKVLTKLGVVDVMLAVDTLLFIDPLLLPKSRHPEISNGAVLSYKQRFEKIIKLLSVSKNENDAPVRAARKLFKFSEIGATCLGYGSSTKGSGFGPDLIEQTLDTAKEIVGLGITDIDMFMALALFEEGIGPDRISDMTTNIILEDLLEFTDRVNVTLKIPTKIQKVGTIERDMPVNPISGEPLILVPTDIVRELPLAADWSDIGRVARENEELRENLNDLVGGIWTTMTRKEKDKAKQAALQSKKAFDSVLELIKTSKPQPYDFSRDPAGEAYWARYINSIDSRYPLDLGQYENRTLTLDEAEEMVIKIVEQFRDLVENKGIWKELWADDDTPRKEKAAQRLMFVTAYSYCQAHNLDLTPESDCGNGPVDFKFSQGADKKIVVEVKLSRNGQAVHGYEKQLEIYKASEDTSRGVFVFIDIGSVGKKWVRIQNAKLEMLEKHGRASTPIYIDGKPKESASVRK